MKKNKKLEKIIYWTDSKLKILFKKPYQNQKKNKHSISNYEFKTKISQKLI